MRDEPAIDGVGRAFGDHLPELGQAVGQAELAMARRQRPHRRARHAGAEPVLQRAREQPAHRPGQTGGTLPQAEARDVAVIAAEQLVAAVAREADGDRAASQRAHQMGRDLRGIGERLVPHPGQARHDVERVPAGDVERDMVGAEMRGHRARMPGLVILRIVEADGEGPHRPRRLGLHQGDDGRAVDAARQEGADRHVRLHPPKHRILEQRLEIVDQRRRVRQRIGRPGRRHRAEIPIRRRRGQLPAAGRRSRRNGPGSSLPMPRQMLRGAGT